MRVCLHIAINVIISSLLSYKIDMQNKTTARLKRINVWFRYISSNTTCTEVPGDVILYAFYKQR